MQAVVTAAVCAEKSYCLLAPTASVTTTETTTSLDAVAGAVRVTCEVVPVSDCPESVPPEGHGAGLRVHRLYREQNRAGRINDRG